MLPITSEVCHQRKSIPLYKHVSLDFNFRLTRLMDAEEQPITVINIMKRLFSLPYDYQLKTNCKRLMEIQFIGLGDVHNQQSINKINTEVASFFLQAGDKIYTECDRTEVTDLKFGAMYDRTRLSHLEEKCWDTNKTSFNPFLKRQIDLLVFVQRLKYMVKFDVQYLYHKKNRSNESFLKISNDLDAMITSFPKKFLQHFFRSEIINKKNRLNQTITDLCSHKFSPSLNPHYLFSKITFLLMLNKYRFQDIISESFLERQRSLVEHASHSIKQNKKTVVIAGAFHLLCYNTVEKTVSTYITTNPVGYLLTSPNVNNPFYHDYIPQSNLPENVDFSVIRRLKNRGTNIDIDKIMENRLSTLADLLFGLYAANGSRYPNPHPKHRTPGPHPKGKIQVSESK